MTAYIRIPVPALAPGELPDGAGGDPHADRALTWACRDAEQAAAFARILAGDFAVGAAARPICDDCRERPAATGRSICERCKHRRDAERLRARAASVGQEALDVTDGAGERHALAVVPTPTWRVPTASERNMALRLHRQRWQLVLGR